MEEKQELKKLQIVCKVGSYALLIMTILMAISIAGLALSLFFPEVIGEVLGIESADAYVATASLIVGAIFAFLLMYAAYQLMCSLSNERTPFTRKNVKFLKTISLLLLISGVVDNITSWILSRLNLGMEFNLSISFILAAVVLYSITLIFQYGVALQEESDLTV